MQLRHHDMHHYFPIQVFSTLWDMCGSGQRSYRLVWRFTREAIWSSLWFCPHYILCILYTLSILTYVSQRIYLATGITCGQGIYGHSFETVGWWVGWVVVWVVGWLVGWVCMLADWLASCLVGLRNRKPLGQYVPDTKPSIANVVRYTDCN